MLKVCSEQRSTPLGQAGVFASQATIIDNCLSARMDVGCSLVLAWRRAAVTSATHKIHSLRIWQGSLGMYLLGHAGHAMSEWLEHHNTAQDFSRAGRHASLHYVVHAAGHEAVCALHPSLDMASRLVQLVRCYNFLERPWWSLPESFTY